MTVAASGASAAAGMTVAARPVIADGARAKPALLIAGAASGALALSGFQGLELGPGAAGDLPEGAEGRLALTGVRDEPRLPALDPVLVLDEEPEHQVDPRMEAGDV